MKPAYAQNQANPAYVYVTSMIAWVFSWRLVPETKGRTLENIAEIWLNKK